MEKPNFEIIATIFSPEWDRSKGIIHTMKKEWEKIECGQISYSHNSEFTSLIDRYELNSNLQDIKYLTYNFLKWDRFSDFEKSDIIKENKKKRVDLVCALKLLNYHEGNTSITISTPTCGKYTITSLELIKIISDSLLNEFKNSEAEYIIEDIVENNNEIDWYNRIESAYKKQTKKDSNPGRRKGKLLTKKMVYYLWKYLQEFTHLKSNEGKEYSQEQARFIFDLLELNNLLDKNKEISRKEDVIGYYLKEFKKYKFTISL